MIDRKHGRFQTILRSGMAVFAVMCIAAIFSLTLLGCKDDSGDSGGGGKSVRVIIQNISDKDITGIAVFDVRAQGWILGNGGMEMGNNSYPSTAEAYDTTKTVAAGATGEFTVTVQTLDLGFASYDFMVYVDFEGRTEHSNDKSEITNSAETTSDEHTRIFDEDYYLTRRY